jgi:hypothetical protein
MAMLAGGVTQAKKYIKTQLSSTRAHARIFGVIGALFLVGAGAILYYKLAKYRQDKQLQESIEKSKNEILKMPTVRADEMGTHCLICLCNPSNIVLIPCNHLCICSECFLKYKNSEDQQRQGVKCPMCRLDVDLMH